MRCSVFGCMLASVIFASSAFAFKEETQPAPKAPSANLSTEKAKPQGKDGTVVSIPGLGKLGVIPKLDFGLELLYGDEGAKSSLRDDDQGTKSDDGDLRIRGSIKHRF